MRANPVYVTNAMMGMLQNEESEHFLIPHQVTYLSRMSNLSPFNDK